MRNERGFSLLLVLLVVIVMSVLGALVTTMAWSDSGAAGAREKRAHALVAAETGFYLLTASGNASVIADKIEAQKGLLQDLPSLDTDGVGGPDFHTRYVVDRVGGTFFVEGQLLSPDRASVISRVRLGGRIRSFSGPNGYEGQERHNPRGTGILDQRDDYEKEYVVLPF